VLVRGQAIRDEYLIVQGGKLAESRAHSYRRGRCDRGSEEAARCQDHDRRARDDHR